MFAMGLVLLVVQMLVKMVVQIMRAVGARLDAVASVAEIVLDHAMRNAQVVQHFAMRYLL